MPDYIILIFETTLQLTIRDRFDVENSSEYTRHSESGTDGGRKERLKSGVFNMNDIKLDIWHDVDMSMSFTV